MKKISKNILCFLISFVFISMSEASSLQSSPIIIFVSFSMPMMSVKRWMDDAEKIHAPVVIRGLVNNSFKETTQKMMELTKDNRGGVQLDPTIFSYFHINKVPAVVVNSQTDFDVIYGDTTLVFSLKKIIDRNDGCSSVANDAVNRLSHT